MGPKSTFQSDLRWEFASTLLPTLWGPWGVLREIIDLRSSLPWRLSRTKHGEGGGEKSEWMRKGDGFSLEVSRGYRALGSRGGRWQEDPRGSEAGWGSDEHAGDKTIGRRWKVGTGLCSRSSQALRGLGLPGSLALCSLIILAAHQRLLLPLQAWG